MKTNAMVSSKNEAVMLATKDPVASCKHGNNVIITKIKPNNVKR
ncbi:MAG: hypothetical protein PXX83_04505 [Candidatus Nitrosotalea sp.]|nr:hypothetical protein [Candidatus Nitrosotalea sp.]